MKRGRQKVIRTFVSLHTLADGSVAIVANGKIKWFPVCPKRKPTKRTALKIVRKEGSADG